MFIDLVLRPVYCESAAFDSDVWRHEPLFALITDAPAKGELSIEISDVICSEKEIQ